MVLFDCEDEPFVLWQEREHVQKQPMHNIGKGRSQDESRFEWAGDVPVGEPFVFRVGWESGRVIKPADDVFFSTSADCVWLQDEHFFDYCPAAHVSPSRVTKIDSFVGSLSPRPLYIYLPRGYKEHIHRKYPVLYMHDGQNCFEAYVEDSFAGSWQADLAADQMIREGKMRECVIVGVSNGSKERFFEYMPDFSRLPDFVLDSYYQVEVEEEPITEEPDEADTSPDADTEFVEDLDLNDEPELLEVSEVSELPEERREYTNEESVGRASATVAFYASDVAPFIESRYRVKSGRENRATCGSSMGGLMTMFFAWEAPSFARHHAAMSTSFWLTRTKDKELPWIKRLQQEEPRDIRLWLDSGTGDRGEHDDGMKDAILARDALLANGFVQGASFHYELAEGAQHHESAWAARLPRALTFLFPPTLDW